MLDQLKDLFKEGVEYNHLAGLLQQMSNILNIVNPQYMKDSSGKNAAIDLICSILQGHKDQIFEVSADVACCAEGCSDATA